MGAFIAEFETHAQSEGAVGVDDGELASADCIECAHDAELAVIIGCGVTKCGDVDVHLKYFGGKKGGSDA